MDYIPEKKLQESGKNDQSAAKIPLSDQTPPVDTMSDLREPTPLTRQEQSVSRVRLINKLNHFHFTAKTIRIHFENPKTNHSIVLDASPCPCFNRYAVGLWHNPDDASHIPDFLRFTHFELITDEQVIHVPADVRAVNRKGICFRLPEKSVQYTFRKTIRRSCLPIDVQLIQNGVIFSAALLDFSVNAFRVVLIDDKGSELGWLNENAPLNVVMLSEGAPVYSGECRILKHCDGRQSNQIVLKPDRYVVQRFTPRIHRSRRSVLTPSPDIRFEHPVTGSPVTLKALDISGSGLSVEDDAKNTLLLPGLILPSMTVSFSGSYSFQCRAQVLYCREDSEKSVKPLVRCGIAFLDVAPDDHVKLLSLLHNAENRNIYLCDRIDVDKLWEFFFDTGFIYPRKYVYLRGEAEQIKKTYQALYCRQTGISRHFTWQNRGGIMAHLSMLRFYENTWLIQHLAARTSHHIGAGIEMLKQVSEFAMDSHRLASARMRYLLCYFRPHMRFPNHFFGKIARNVENPRACSVDQVAYVSFRCRRQLSSLPDPWRLEKPGSGDLDQLEDFYKNASGGIMLEALDLICRNDLSDRQNLASRYREHGLKRERRVYALKKNGHTKAVIMVNISDSALNLSDLTNCVSLFLLEQDAIEPEMVYNALSVVAAHYDRPRFPVLVYPHEYVRENRMPCDRVYNLWALDMNYADECFQHYTKLFV